MNETGPDDKNTEPSKPGTSKGGQEEYSLNFDISKSQREYIDDHVKSGEHQTAGEFMRDVLRRDMAMEKYEREYAEIDRHVSSTLTAYKEGNYKVGTAEELCKELDEEIAKRRKERG